nr:hypothetical protein [Tanacetum cinerariifolium]
MSIEQTDNRLDANEDMTRKEHRTKHSVNHESWFLGFEGRKNNHRKKMSIDTVTSSMSESDKNLNNATPRFKEVVSQSVVDDTMEKEKLRVMVTITESYPPLPTQVATLASNALGKTSYAQNSLDDNTILESFPPLSTPVTTEVGNAPGKSSYANVTGRVYSCYNSMDGLDAMLENGPWFIQNNPLILKKWHPDENLLKKMSSYARVMIELHADVELKDNIVMVVPKIKGEGYYTCNIHVEYEWKPPRCACCKGIRVIILIMWNEYEVLIVTQLGENRESMEAYKKVHNETVRSELRIGIVQQSMKIDMWEIKEKLAERREQMAIRAYEEDKRHEE